MRSKKIFGFAFLVLLLAPTLLMFTDIDASYKQDENRKLSTLKIKTASDIKRLIINFKNYYTDNFGGRLLLYNFYKSNISDVLNESPSNNKIVYGKEDWLFLGDFHNNAFSKAKGSIVFSESELEIVKKNILEVKNWCTKNNIDFYITIPPGKHTVYRDYLPYKYFRAKTKIDQLIEVYPDLIDLRPDLFKAQHKEFLYKKRDTHWNEKGAFIGYKSILTKIQTRNPYILKLDNSDIEKIKYIKYKGDLDEMLKTNTSENTPFFILKNKSSKKVKSILEVPTYHRLNPDTYELRYSNPYALNGEKIMILRDSFSKDLIKFINVSFQDAVFIYNHYFDKELIAKEKPDILLYEITERFADRLLEIHQK